MTERTIHFVSGLPRSGSTLLMQLLAQHPDVHVTPPSACHDALFCVRNQWGQWIEHRAAKSLSATENEQRVLSAILHSYHDTDKPVVVDKGRGWSSLIELAEFALDRPAKIIVPVRGIPEILASLEKLYRKGAATGQLYGDYFALQTVVGRCEHWLRGDQVLGLAYNRLKDALQRGLRDRLHLVEFDDLTQHPEETMQRVWNFFEMTPPKHDFDHVEQVTHEDDAVHGIMGDHQVRPRVRPVRDDSVEVLGREIVRQYTGVEFWRTAQAQIQERMAMAA